MMPSRLQAVAAAALVAPVLAVEAAAAQETTPPRRTQGDLYAPSPERASYETSSMFFRAYGMTLRPVELDVGVRLGTFATAPRAEVGIVDVRAGVDAGGSRRWLPTLLGLLAALAAVAFLLAGAPAARAAVPDGFVGITTEDAYTGSDTYARTQLSRQRAAGFTIARQVFRWNEIEPKNGEYDFSATDRFVLNAARSGIRVMPLLLGEPTWASSRPRKNRSRNLFPPKRPGYLGRFAAKLALRYGPNGTLWATHPSVTPTPITSYQLWNEPNFPLYWGGKPSAAAYARLVRITAQRLRAVQPDAYIVSAGIPDSSLAQKPSTFIRRMLRAKAGPSLDAIAVHPYARDVDTVMALTRSFRASVDAAGGRDLDLWATEIGWAVGGPRTPKRTVSRNAQGPIIADAFRRLAAERETLRLRGVVYFAWRDSEIYPGGRDFWGLHTGLLNRAGKEKKAMATVSQALRGLE